MSVIELTKENFQTVVEESDILLVDFWAQWCGPCRRFAPVFEAAAAKHENITFGKLNVASNRTSPSLHALPSTSSNKAKRFRIRRALLECAAIPCGASLRDCRSSG